MPKPIKLISNFNAYRSIALLTLGEILEKLLQKRIHAFLEKNNLLPIRQYQFKTKRGTKDAVLALHKKIEP